MSYQAHPEVGPRGSTPINSHNRGPVRKWLVAAGVDSHLARTLTNGQLDKAYNDTTDNTLASLIGQEPKPREEPAPAPAPVSGKATDNTDAVARQLATVLAQLHSKAELDPAQVREIVREEIKRQAPQVIELRTPGGTQKLEGRVHKDMSLLLPMLNAGCHVWLVGPAGSGKTTLAEQAAKALGRKFYSTGAVTSDFRLIGYQTATGELVRTPFREAFENGGVFLWDEIDASNPNALVAFNQALANGRFAFPDGMVDKHPEFIAIAAGNTWGSGATAEYVGRVRQDAASLDRFVFLAIEYDTGLEQDMVGPEFKHWALRVQAYRKAAAKLGIKVVLSPRATIHGAKLLHQGLPESVVADSVLRKNLDSSTWDKLRAEAAV